MSSCFWSTVWVVPGEPVNLLFQNYIHQVGQKVLFSNTCCCTLVFSPSNSALRIMCRADPVTHMRATVYSPCNKLAAPQALRCWQAKTRSDEHLWQKVLTCLLCQARKKKLCFLQVTLLLLWIIGAFGGDFFFLKWSKLSQFTNVRRMKNASKCFLHSSYGRSNTKTWNWFYFVSFWAWQIKPTEPELSQMIPNFTTILYSHVAISFIVFFY